MPEGFEGSTPPPDFQIANGPLDKLKKQVFDSVSGSLLPNKDYQSTVITFGSKVEYDADGTLIWNAKGLMPFVDRVGDWFLRQYDDHIAKDPKQFLKHGKYKEFFSLLVPGPKRSQGNGAEVAENVRRLGLDEYYGPHAKGIAVKEPHIFEHGIALQDIWRQDVVNSPVLETIDRFDALKVATQYVKSLHTQASGGIGEVLPSDILFTKEEDGNLKPVLNIPDKVYAKDKDGKPITTPAEQKALDLLDFLFSVPVEELRRNPDSSLKYGDGSSIEKIISTIISSYADETPETVHILKTVQSFARRGRITLAGDEEMLPYPQDGSFTKNDRSLTRIHNNAKYRVEEVNAAPLRTLIIDTVSAVLPKTQQPNP